MIEPVWRIPKEYWNQVGADYRAMKWDSLIWWYNHYVAPPDRQLCYCPGSHPAVKLYFEKFKTIGEDAGNNELGET